MMPSLNAVTTCIIVALIAGILAAAILILVFRNKLSARLAEFLQPAESTQLDRYRSIRQLLAEHSNIVDLGKVILREIQRILKIDAVQLTLYYDKPLAIEVTSIKIQGEDIHTLTRTMRQDDETLPFDDDEMLDPASAELNLPLTFRDRLIGLIVIGKRENGVPLNENEIKNLNGMLPLFTAAIDNVTMIRNLSETNQRLLESEKLASIGQLAGGIAHEIRNPLSSMKMNLQGLMKSGELTEKNQRRMKICLDEIERLNNIIGELLHLSRRTKLEVKPTSANRVIKQCIQLCKAEIERRNIKVETVEDDNLTEIMADEARLTHALLNLVLNAAQAIEKDGIIKISAEPFGSGIEFNVEDNGPGIPEEIRRDLYNPFFTTKAEGLGLGLANVLKTVQEHGGELDFTSDIGKGTLFSIRLPEKPPDSDYDPTVQHVQ